jgi:hypothetical protein
MAQHMNVNNYEIIVNSYEPQLFEKQIETFKTQGKVLNLDEILLMFNSWITNIP